MLRFLLPAAMLATTATAQEAPVPVLAPADGGKIVMYRQGAVMGMGLGCPIRYHERKIVDLSRNKYADWSVPKGRYILSNKTSSIEIQVDPGETRYVRCVIKTGFMTGRADLQIVDKETFEQNSADYQRTDVAFNPEPARAH